MFKKKIAISNYPSPALIQRQDPERTELSLLLYNRFMASFRNSEFSQKSAVFTSARPNSTSRKTALALLILLLSIIIAGCTAQPSTSVPTPVVETAALQTALAEGTPAAQQSAKPSEWVGLLIALPDNSLILADPKTTAITPISLPANTRFDSLSSALSPNKSLLLLTQEFDQNDIRLLVYDLPEGQVHTEIPLETNQTVDYEALFKQMTGEISQEMIKKGLGAWALEGGFTDSLGRAWWSENSDTFFFVNAAEDGYTHLFDYSLSTGISTQLDDRPFFVESLSASPGNNQFLLRKGVNPAFSSPKLTSFYLLGSDGSLQILTPPQVPNVSYWKVQWQTDETLLFLPYDAYHLYYSALLSYQPSYQTWQTLWGQPFHQWLDLGEKQAFLQINPTKSRLTLVQNGQNQHEYVLNGICPAMTLTTQACCQVLVECNDPENPLYGIDKEGKLVKSVQPELTMLSSPDKSWTLTQQAQSDGSGINLTLYNAASQQTWVTSALNLRQYFWSPDGLYLLYISQNGLYQMDLSNGENILLYEHTFDDYPNLEARWVSPVLPTP